MPKEIPDWVKRGTTISPANPQPEVRKAAETADWDYAEEARYLYHVFEILIDRLVDPLHRLDRSRMPMPVIAFENLRNNRTLGAFKLTPNPNGILNEIIFNTEHYIEKDGKLEWRFGRYAQVETGLHELFHELQQLFGKNPVKIGKVYHNAEFVQMCENVGLHPKLGEGYHLKPADGAFEILMKELGIEKPEGTELQPSEWSKDWFKWWEKFYGDGLKGKSTLTKWSCGCTNVWVGRKEVYIRCLKCGEVFAPALLGMTVPEPKKDSGVSAESTADRPKGLEVLANPTGVTPEQDELDEQKMNERRDAELDNLISPYDYYEPDYDPLG